MSGGNVGKLFDTLSRNLDVFLQEVKAKKPSLMATDEWSVKDVFCHIVFWHENYAINYKALAEGKESSLLEGPGYALNIEGVSILRDLSMEELIARLRKAQESLYKSIVLGKVPQMTYKKYGHIYKTAEFLDLIARHIKTHTMHVSRAK